MKQFFFLLLSLFLFQSTARTQNEGLSGFVEKYKNDRAFTYAFLSKDLFEVVSRTEIEDKDWKKLHSVVKNIGSLSILAADSIATARELYREVLELVPADEFDELLTVRDGQDNVRIWVKDDGADAVTDLILAVGTSDEFVLICFSGNLELGDLPALVEMFDDGAAEQLARTAETVSVEFSVNPNPNSGVFTLTYIDGQDVPAFLAIIDQNGRQISSLNVGGAQVQQVNLPEIPSGVYWLQLKTQQGKVGVKQVQIVKR